MVKPYIIKNGSELLPGPKAPGQIAGGLEGALDLHNTPAQRAEIGAGKHQANLQFCPIALGGSRQQTIHG
jgi:hypothetical protein